MLSETAETIELFNRLARIIGRPFMIEMGVDESGGVLVFVDDVGDPVMNDGQEIIAADGKEVASKEIGEFAVRALRAAAILKYQEIERSRKP